jgi:hypothetical protein
MYKYSILARFFIIIGIIWAINILNIEYSQFLILLSLAYFIGFMILAPAEEKKVIKYLLLVIDIAYISAIIYLTGLPYISVFILPLITDFIEDTKDLIVFGILSAIPIGLSLYLTNFNDLLFIPLILGGLVGFFKLKAVMMDREKYFLNLKLDFEDIYIKNLKLQDSLERKKQFFNFLNLLKKFRDKKIKFKDLLVNLKEYFKADNILFYHHPSGKCVKIKEINCDPRIFNYITENPQLFHDSRVNEMLGSDYVLTVVIEYKNKPMGTFIFLYKVRPNISDKYIQMLQDNFRLFYLELEEKKEGK